jgi:hypothetical protein
MHTGVDKIGLAGGSIIEECRCFDRPQPTLPSGVIDDYDVQVFLQCVNGAYVDPVPNCGL